MPGQNQRALGHVQYVGRRLHCVGTVFGPRFEAGKIDFEIIAKSANRILHILADVDQHHSRTALASNIEGFLHNQRQLCNVGHQIVVFAYRLGDADHVRLLKRVGPQKIGRDLAGNCDNGHAVHLCSRQPGDKIRRPRTAGDYTNAHLPGGPGKTVGHVGSTLFVAHKHVMDAAVRFVLGQGVVGRQDRSARVAKDNSYSLTQKGFPDHLRPAFFLGAQIVSAIVRFSLG